MCLDIVYRGKQKKEALAKLPESGYYWKAVVLKDKKYWPIHWNSKPFKNGLNKKSLLSLLLCRLLISLDKYLTGYHLFIEEETANRYMSHTTAGRIVIKCKVNKKYITAIGKEEYSGLCIVTTRFWCPKPKK